MPDPWPLSAASRWPVVAAATALLLGGALLWGGGTAASPPPPAPTAAVRASLGAPRPAPGLSGVLGASQSLLPDVLARAAALPGVDARGRWWVAAADRWRVELQGTGHDWQVVRDGGDVQVYDDARQRLIDVPLALLPDGLASVGPTRVVQARPTTVAGRPVHVLRYLPQGRDVLLREVRVSVDAATGVPLAVRVLAAGREGAVVDLHATSAEAGPVPAGRTRLDPPETASTIGLGTLALAAQLAGGGPLDTVGRGWERVVVIRGGLPGGPLPGAQDEGDGRTVLRTALFSVVSVRRGGRTVTGIGLLPPERVAAAVAR